MEWRGLLSLDLRGHAHSAAFHPSLPLLVVSVGRQLAEFDLVTGSLVARADIGGVAVRMGYSSATGHTVIAALEDYTIRAWDQDWDQTTILYSPSERRVDRSAEVHLAIVPNKPLVYFAAHKRTTINVVGTVEGVRPPTKLKTDQKKPIMGLVCHPRQPILYIAYGDGTMRAHHTLTFATLYNLQLEDPTVKLLGAGGFAFHHIYNYMFVGDRSGALLCWDVSSQQKADLVGFLQIANDAIMGCTWHPTLEVLLVLTMNGELKAYSARAFKGAGGSAPAPPPPASLASPTGTAPGAPGGTSPLAPTFSTSPNFFADTMLEEFDLRKVMLQAGGPSLKAPPGIRLIIGHPRLNYTVFLYLNQAGGEEENKRRATHMSAERRKRLLSVLQDAKSLPDPGQQREKMSALGSGAVISEQLLQQQLLLARGQSKLVQPSPLDYARKMFLFGAASASATAAVVSRSTPQPRLEALPVLRLEDPLWPAHDSHVHVPFHCPMNFFNPEQAIFKYPARTFLLDGCALFAFSLSSTALSLLTSFPPVDGNGNQRKAHHAVYSPQQHTLIVFFRVVNAAAAAAQGEGVGTTSIVVQRFIDNTEPLGEGMPSSTDLRGIDGAFTGHHDKKFFILDEDGYGLTLFSLPKPEKSQEELDKEEEEEEEEEVRKETEEEEDSTFTGFGYASRFDEIADEGVGAGGDGAGKKKKKKKGDDEPDDPVQFMFETPVQRIFGTPMENTLLYSCSGSHMGLITVFADEDGVPCGDLVEGEDGMRWLTTKKQEGRVLSLKPLESVIEVWWHTRHGSPVAAVMTTMRLMIVSSSLYVLSSTSASSSASFPPFKSCCWVGPTLLFSTATTVSMLGWDSIARPVVAVDKPDGVLMGSVNDRLFVAARTSNASGSSTGLEVRPRLVGLLEPLLLGWITLVHAHGAHPSIHLPHLVEQIVNRFDCMRVTPRLVEVLSRGPALCCDLALEIAESGPQFNFQIRAMCALRARQFSTALRILSAEFHRLPTYPKCPPTSTLFHHFRTLGRRCIMYGQFDKAKETFDMVKDYEAIYDLAIAPMNPSALRNLTEELQNRGANPELSRHCDQVLKVRSSLWSGQLNQLAKEALQAKDPSWAGGNWVLKLPPAEKGAPTKWELSTECTAYMKTKAGGIKVINPTSISVYLGSLLGDGTVTEIKEILPPEEEERLKKKKKKKATDAELMAAAAKTFLTIDTGLDNTGSAAIAAAAARGEGAEDEDEDEAQRRAHAEFQRGLYGTAPDSDSDDDDGVSVASSRRSKIKLRIKDKAEASKDGMDAMQLREASLRLEDPTKARQRRAEGLPMPGLAPPPEDAQRNPLQPPQPWQQFPKAMGGVPMAGGQAAPFGELVAAGAAAVKADTVPGSQPPNITPVWTPSPVNAVTGVGGGGVPAQAIALGYAVPRLPPAPGGAPGVPGASANGVPGPQGGDPNAQALALVPAGAGEGQPGAGPTIPDGFGETAPPFVAQPTPAQQQQQRQGQGQERGRGAAQRGQPMGMVVGGGKGFIAGLPPVSFGEQQGGQEFGGLLASGENGAPPGVPPGANASGQQAQGLPSELSSLDPASRKAAAAWAASQAAAAAAAAGEPQAAPAPVQPKEPAAPEPLTALPTKILPKFVPRGSSAALCFKAALVHLDDNRLEDATACLDEAFLTLAKDRSLGKDIVQQARLCAVYKIGTFVLLELARLARAENQGAVGAKDEMARISRHLASLPLQPKHRISCMRTAIKRNMESQNYAFSKKLLDVLLTKAPPNKQQELRALVNVCVQRGLTDRTLLPGEDSAKFCAATLTLLPTIGHDTCDVCFSNFSALNHPACPVCGMGTVRRSDAAKAPPGARPSGPSGGGAVFANPF